MKDNDKKTLSTNMIMQIISILFFLTAVYYFIRVTPVLVIAIVLFIGAYFLNPERLRIKKYIVEKFFKKDKI